VPDNRRTGNNYCKSVDDDSLSVDDDRDIDDENAVDLACSVIADNPNDF